MSTFTPRPKHNHTPEEYDEKTGDCPRCKLNRAAPDLLEELEGLIRTFEQTLISHVYDAEEWSPEDVKYLARLRLLCARARGTT